MDGELAYLYLILWNFGSTTSQIVVLTQNLPLFLEEFDFRHIFIFPIILNIKSMKIFKSVVAYFILTLSLLTIQNDVFAQKNTDGHTALVELFKEWRKFEKPPLLNGVSNYTIAGFRLYSYPVTQRKDPSDRHFFYRSLPRISQDFPCKQVHWIMRIRDLNSKMCFFE